MKICDQLQTPYHKGKIPEIKIVKSKFISTYNWFKIDNNVLTRDLTWLGICKKKYYLYNIVTIKLKIAMSLQ